MNMNNVAIDHLCNVVRRDFEEEFRDLKIYILRHKNGEREAALSKQKDQILEYVGGEHIYELLNNQHEKEISEFLGICVDKPDGFFNAFASPVYTAVITINMDRYISEDNAMQYMYHMCWHALRLMQKIKSGDIKLDKDQHIIAPKYDRLEITRNNLMADVFGAHMIAHKGSEDFIITLAKERSLETLSKVMHHTPSYYAFPIAHEACSLIYNDLKDTLKQSRKPISLIMEMAEEVALTYDDRTLKKWWEFAEMAQELAWMNTTPEDILGYALYSCDDPYLRATAHQIYENIDKQPALHTNVKTYNPFASREDNKRYHKTKLEDAFKAAISNVSLDGEAHHFLSAAKKMNNDLLKGHFSGWCSYAFSKAHDVYISEEHKGDLEYVTKTFYNSIERTPWETLHEISKLILKIRRQNEEINFPALLSLLKKADKYQPFAEGLEISPNNSSIPAFNNRAEGTGALHERLKNFTIPLKRSPEEKRIPDTAEKTQSERAKDR